MTPVPLTDWRAIQRQSPVRARHLWSEGLTVSATPADTGAALSALAMADLSGRRMRVLAEIAVQDGTFHLPAVLLERLQMEPGWLGQSGADPGLNPLCRIGPALALIAMARGMAGLAPVAAVLAHDPGQPGVGVQISR